MVKKQSGQPWAPEEKAAALALLAENGGKLRLTARQFRTTDGRTVAESVLRLWQGTPGERPPTKLVIDAKRDRVTVLKGILRKLEQGFDAALDEFAELVTMLVRKHPRDLATTIGILTDKVLLLEGKATEITEQRTLSGFLSTAKWLEPEPKAGTDARPN
jgi:hypothetical protein